MLVINYLFIDFKNKGISGSHSEKVLEMVGIYVNKNTIPGDTSDFNPSDFNQSGIRIGTPVITTIGITNTDIRFIVNYIDIVLNEASNIIKENKPKTMISTYHIHSCTYHYTG